MHVANLEWQLVRNGVDQRLRAWRHIIVGNDDAHRCIGRHLERADRAQRRFQLAPAVCAHTDVDRGLAARILPEAGHDGAASRFHGVRSCSQNPSDQARCMTMAEKAASGP